MLGGALILLSNLILCYIIKTPKGVFVIFDTDVLYVLLFRHSNYTEVLMKILRMLGYVLLIACVIVCAWVVFGGASLFDSVCNRKKQD